MKLNGDEPVKKFKTMALNSVGRSEKSSKDSSEESDNDEIYSIIKSFQHFTKNKNTFYGRSGGFKGSSSRGDKVDQRGSFNCQKPNHFIDDCPGLQKENIKKESFQKNNFIRKLKKSPMATREELDNEEETYRE